MKLFKNSLCFMICFIITATTVLITGSTNVQASEDPVQLCHARYHIFSADGSTGHYEGNIAVKNLDPNKKVTVHYCYEYNQNNWKDVSAKYVKTTSDGYEIWHFETPCYYYAPCIFAIKCEANDQTYWDNNNGNNYTVTRDVILAKDSILNLNSHYEANQTYDRIQSINGYIALKNLSSEKNVKVRITEDNWQTYTDIDAVYHSSQENSSIEYWHYDYKTKTTPKNVQFAVYYEVNGVTYWDNNGGSNYFLGFR